MEKLQNSKLDLNYDLMLGRFLLNELPPLRPRSIRIFLCAPYNDTYNETCYLFTHIFPKLRDFSMSRYGLEFQVINLNWDIDKNLKLLKESLIEIEKCKSQSIGITFLSLIGDDYGSPILPEWIERQNFEILKSCLLENKQNVDLLDKYFKLNINYLSNRYELINEGLSLEVENLLLELIKTGIKLAVEKNYLKEELLNEMNETMLQKLMKTGIFLNNQKQDRVFSFVRVGNSENTNSHDVFPTKKNTLEYLRDREINYFIPVEQIFRIKFSNADNQYLKNFGLHYKKIFENLINKFIRETPEFGYDSLYEQVLFHLNYIKLNKINEIAPRTQTIIKNLTDYVLDDTQRQPFILTGNLGSGKTSLISTLASNLFLQLTAYDGSNKHAIVVRFIGIDGKSEYLRSLLKSICSQLQYIKTKSLKEIENVPNNLNDLKKFFKKFLTENLEQVNGQNRKLIIILDSLQDLTKNDYSYKLDWLPKYLNPMCKLILTVSAESTELMERLSRKFTNQKCYAMLDSLNQEQAEYMIKKFLSKKNYRLEADQHNLIINLIKTKSVLSLHLKILSEEFLNWRSSTSLNDCIIKETLRQALENFIINLENKFGFLTVKYVLSYISISKNGFSENELQDLLSLDNSLMRELKAQDLIKQNDNDVLRMPWLYILNILNSISNHLIYKPMHGIYTICWKHSIFKEVVFKRYLDEKKIFIYLHRNVSEYYLGLWASPKLKPLKYEKIIKSNPDPNNPQKLVLVVDKPVIKKFKINANRLVPSQPILYEDFHTHVKPRFNLRKLYQLPYHLINANMINELFENVFFNIEWIYSKINAFDLYSVLYDYDLYKLNPEANLVCESLKMSESAIVEDAKLLFSQLTGRLLPYYNLYDRIRSLIDQTDHKSAITNPIIPIGHIFHSPCWINQETLDLDLDPSDNLQIDLLESDFNGQILLIKKSNSTMCKIYDIDLLDFKNEIFTGKEKVYCSKNGDFVCLIENNSKFIIRRIESGEFYGSVDFEPSEIAYVLMSNNYACFILRKVASPIIIDLNSSCILNILPYQTCFCALSPDESVLIVHSEKNLNYHVLPSFNRVITLESFEIPQKILFCKKNTKLFVLSKDTKQITCFNLIIEKKIQSSSHVLQDRDIIDIKLSFDESILLVCSLYCIYIFDINAQEAILKFKLKLSSIESFIGLDPKLINENSNEILKVKNAFNGFGCTLNDKFIYATFYTYLVCYDSITGSILRVFQTSLSANRILRTFSSNLNNNLISFLDNGKFILWNLNSLELKQVKFEDLRIFNDQIELCLPPKTSHLSSKNTNLSLCYTKSYPDAKTCNLKSNFNVKSIIKSCNEEKNDNSLISLIKLAILDDNSKFCFIISDIEDFNGKLFPEEKDFYKKLCTIIDIQNDNRIIDKFSYVVKKNSRLEINGKFLNYKDEVFLIVKQISCINDFDPYCTSDLDWTEFETCVKIFGPIKSQSVKLELVDEFKMVGESLETDLCINKDHIFASLMQECNKLYDKQQPGVIKAKRFDIHLNIYELFESKVKNLKVQLYSLSEFLNYDEYNSKTVFLDLRALNDGNLLLIFSKEGYGNLSNYFEYDYQKFRFIRNRNVQKGAVLYEPKSNQVLKKFFNIFSKETSIERIIISDGVYSCDENFNLYDLSSGKFLRNIKKNHSNLNFSFKFTQFLFNGRYLITCLEDLRKILILRCYDSSIVGSFRLNDEISCLTVGEMDRTVLIGTKTGYVLPIKLVIDLEHNDAVNNYIKYYRCNLNESESKSIENEINQVHVNLKNDIKRVIHSAHAHRQLKSRESRLSSALSSQNSIMSNELSKNLNFHSGIAKLNLTAISAGIRQNGTSSRACVIQ